MRFIAEWWRKNRPSVPTLFDEELHDVIDRLKAQPMLGLEYETVRGHVVRRALLPKSAQHVYYSVDDVKHTIVVLHVWGARRGEPPRL